MATGSIRGVDIY